MNDTSPTLDAFPTHDRTSPPRPPLAAVGMPAWTFPVVLHEGELLSSWLCRSAHAHGSRAHAFLSLRLPGIEMWTRDPDRHQGEAFWADLARVAGGSADRYRDASLRPISDLLCGAGRLVPAQIPLVLHAGVYHRKRLHHGLQFCPECLLEPPVRFRREWRLAFAVGCRRHGAPLRDGCPACDAPLTPHRAEVGCLGACTVCGVPLVASLAERGVPSSTLTSAMRMQRFCLQAFAAGEGGTINFPGSGREALDTVRCLASLCTADPVRAAVAEAFGMTVDLRGVASRQLERLRTVDRIPVLALLSAWMEGWPASFHVGAEAAGLTGRTFARLAVPTALRREVDRLAAGYLRRRQPRDLRLYGRGMRRLRRRDHHAYMEERAARILACASPSGRP